MRREDQQVSRGWHNVYKFDVSRDHTDPIYARLLGEQWHEDFIRVEERWNGHHLCPPVGMQLASHVWVYRMFGEFPNIRFGQQLDPRQ
jgi:hypothetical protein